VIVNQQLREWVEWAFTHEPRTEDRALDRVIDMLGEPSSVSIELSAEDLEVLERLGDPLSPPSNEPPPLLPARSAAPVRSPASPDASPSPSPPPPARRVDEDVELAPRRPRRRRWWLVLVLLLGLAGVAGGGYYVYYLNGELPSELAP
jgi:hypothetical protein